MFWLLTSCGDAQGLTCQPAGDRGATVVGTPASEVHDSASRLGRLAAGLAPSPCVPDAARSVPNCPTQPASAAHPGGRLRRPARARRDPGFPLGSDWSGEHHDYGDTVVVYGCVSTSLGGGVSLLTTGTGVQRRPAVVSFDGRAAASSRFESPSPKMRRGECGYSRTAVVVGPIFLNRAWPPTATAGASSLTGGDEFVSDRRPGVRG